VSQSDQTGVSEVGLRQGRGCLVLVTVKRKESRKMGNESQCQGVCCGRRLRTSQTRKRKKYLQERYLPTFPSNLSKQPSPAALQTNLTSNYPCCKRDVVGGLLPPKAPRLTVIMLLPGTLASSTSGRVLVNSPGIH
jgi:hypothetical protein